MSQIMQITKEKNPIHPCEIPHITDAENTPMLNFGLSSLDMIGLGWIFTDGNGDYLTSYLANCKRRCNVIE